MNPAEAVSTFHLELEFPLLRRRQVMTKSTHNYTITNCNKYDEGKKQWKMTHNNTRELTHTQDYERKSLYCGLG